ncbi:MAG: NAD(P)-dependent oxidoreductase, partial [Parabacteroides sp.]|nr:NAD(P)-dependent oxidoreductase [Parabacteroides sp.]
KGESTKPYCYTTDCVSAILYILLKGTKGEAYNVANSDTYISIRSLAEYLRENFNPNIKVIVEEHPEMGYAPVTKLNLSTEKLKKLSWNPKYGLKEMFTRLIDSFI